MLFVCIKAAATADAGSGDVNVIVHGVVVEEVDRGSGTIIIIIIMILFL